MKTNIKITPANKTEIEAALHAVNGKAAKHAYTDLGDVEFHVFHAEERLASLKIPLTLRAGATWAATSGLPVANSYDNKRTGTKIMLQRKSTGWALINVERVPVYKEGGASKLTLTRHQYDEATKRLMAGIEIAKETA